MAKRATKAADNVLYKARMDAAKWNDKLASREGAAELTGLDRNRIAYMELGTITPYPEEIVILSEYYNAPELTNYYCSHLCPLGKRTVQPVNVDSLTETTLQLLASLRDIPEITDDLIDITMDGVIDSDEQEEMEEILEKLRVASQKIKSLELIYQKRIHARDGAT